MLDFLVQNDFLSVVIAFLLVLIPAVIIHELGHFVAAKLVGITILEFGIGMPPRALKLGTWRGTDITLNWLPLGGFVRPLGEDMVRQMGDEALSEDRALARERGIGKAMSVGEAPPLGRIFFMANGAIFNFISAFLLFVIIALVGLPEFVGGRVNVLTVQETSPFVATELQSGDVIERVNGEYFADAQALTNRLLDLNDEMITLTIQRENVDGPFDVTVPLNLPRFGPSITAFTEPHPLILDVVANSPAGEAGLQEGDLILTFNGETVSDFATLQAMTREYEDQNVMLTVLRGNDTLEVELMPRSNPPAGEGSMGIAIGQGGFNPALGLVFERGQDQQQLRPQPFGTAVEFSTGRISAVVNQIASLPGQLLAGTAQPEAVRLTSPLGISQIGGLFLQESIERNQPTIILEYIALISLALGITNLLPIPALDGGRILFVLIEIIRGRPIAPEREGMVHLVGLAVLLSLMLVVLFNDITNPITNLLR